MKEDLIKILTDDDCPLLYMQGDVGGLADYLVSKGVTIQRWIPVKEELPNEFVSVLVCIPSDDPLPTVKEAYLADGMWVTKAAYYTQQEVTHWRPMPKGMEVKNDAV